MTGYDASVLNNPDARVLVVAPNWLGDGVMAMPAVQELRRRLDPAARLDVAVRPNQAGLWEMQPAADEILVLPPGLRDLADAVSRLRKRRFAHAVILPNSFRAALAPALARIPHRRGTADQAGRWLLINDPVSLTKVESAHQQWEMAELLLPGPLPERLAPPTLDPGGDAILEAEDLLTRLPSPRLGLIPRAARGPSKEWPADRFQRVAEAWITERGGGVCWLGVAADEAVCADCNRDLGAHGLSLAGKTGLRTFTAVLGTLDAVVANDSGGMHLAAAVGAPVVAVFGLTDPGKTGPLHPSASVLQHAEGVARSIERSGAASRAALEKVTTDEVVERVLAISAASR